MYTMRAHCSQEVAEMTNKPNPEQCGGHEPTGLEVRNIPHVWLQGSHVCCLEAYMLNAT